MATSVIPKSLASDLNALETNTNHKTITVTGTTDNNGFLETSLKTVEVIPLTVTTLRVEGVSQAAYFVDFLNRAGTSGGNVSLRFKRWNDALYTGTIEATLVYESVRS